jgi:hypothetical protein
VYKLWSSSLCSFLQPPVTSLLFGPNILLSILFKIPYWVFNYALCNLTGVISFSKFTVHVT